MSAVLRAAKVMRVNRAHPGVFARYHRGDPGFLGSLWSGIKGAVGGFVAGGPLGAIAGGIGGLAAGSAGAAKGGTLLTNMMGARTQTMGLIQDPTRPNILSPQINIGNVGPGAPLPPMLAPGGNSTQSGYAGPERDPWTPGSGGTPCGSGYHHNKTGYYSQRYGFIPKGTVCVKNRKRNPLNPRAASRALSRLTSTRKAMRGIDRLMNRIGGARPARAAVARKGGCGCRKR